MNFKRVALKKPIYFNRPYIDSIAAQKAAYKAIYRLAGAKEKDRFVLTSSSAEAVNHAVFSAYLDITRQTGKNHFIASHLDEAPALMAMSRLKQMGCTFQMALAEPEGYILPKTVAETITPRTAMISMSWANALTGVIQPVEEIAKLCQDRGILFHLEASNVLGKGSYTMEESGADLFSFNGGLFIREGLEISPLILGGNLDVEKLIALGREAQETIDLSDHVCMEVARLKERFESLVKEGTVLFKEQERLPHISAMVFPGVVGESLLYMLSQKGVHATFEGMMPLLKACHVEPPLCYSGVSFAFSSQTTEEEIDEGAKCISETVRQLQKMSVGVL